VIDGAHDLIDRAHDVMKRAGRLEVCGAAAPRIQAIYPAAWRGCRQKTIKQRVNQVSGLGRRTNSSSQPDGRSPRPPTKGMFGYPCEDEWRLAEGTLQGSSGS